MAFGNDGGTNVAYLKEYYSPDNVERFLFERHKLLGLLPKKEDADGKYLYTAVVYGAGQGRSAAFGTAQSMASLSGEGSVAFHVPMVENFANANVSTKLLSQAPKADKGAFLKAATLISDDQLSNMSNDMSIQLYRGVSGSRGRIGSTTTLASSTLQLATVADALNFEVGMQLDLAAAETTGATRAYGSNNHGLYVQSVNYELGQFTVGTTPTGGGTACNITDAADGIPTAASGDYIYVTGDRNVRFSGLFDWLPATVASNDSFMNVNRSINKVRLAGNYYDGTNGQSIASVLEIAGARVAAMGGRTTHFVMNYAKLAQLSIELGAKAQTVMTPLTNPSIGYDGIKAAVASGTAVCIGDLHCPADKIYGLDIDTWELCSVGKAVRVWDDDGQTWLRTPTAAGMEIRFYSFAALRCLEPRGNIAIKVTAAS